MTLMIHWIVALMIGGTAGVFVGVLLGARRRQRLLTTLSQAAHLEELAALDATHKEKKCKLLREISVLQGQVAERRAEMVRLQAAMIETRDAELRELRTTVVGVAAMRERLGDWERAGWQLWKMSVLVRRELSQVEEDALKKVGELLGLHEERTVHSIEEVSPGDEEARQEEEAEDVHAEAR